MAKCQLCQEETDYLLASKTVSSRLSLDERNNPVYEDNVPFGQEDKEEEFACPNCQAVLFFDQDEAVSFLQVLMKGGEKACR